jgi:hypothetical protein
MRKVSVLTLVSLLAAISITPANASTKSSTVTAAFKSVLNSASNSLDALEQKYQSDVDALDATLSAATKSADSILAQDLQAATALYAPQISSANQKIADAKALFAANNKLKVNQLLFSFQDKDHVYGLFICPRPRVTESGSLIAKRYCANDYGYDRFGDVNKATGATIGGEDWQPGDIAEISFSNSNDKYMQDAVAYNWVTPVNISAYDSSRLAVKTETTNLNDLNLQNGKARSTAQTKHDNAVAQATQARTNALAGLDQTYNAAKAQLEAQQTAADLALLAAKRAGNDANFDNAFVVAYKFEYNYKMVGDIADAAWSGEWTYRTIDSIIKVNKLAAYGDTIASKYSKNAAISFNNSVGNAFTNQPEFRAALNALISTYKQATKTTLKF